MRCVLGVVVCLGLVLALAAPGAAVGGYGCVRTIGEGADQVTVLYAGGTPYEIGYWHGYLLRDQVQANVASALAFAYQYVDSSTLQWVWSLLEPYLAPGQEWQDELQGLADGSGVPLSDLQELIAFPELGEFHCSAFNATGAATADGHMIQIRNLDWDMETGMQDNPLVIIATPDGGYRYANVTFAGFLGCPAGMNAAGIGISEKGDSFDNDNETLSGIPMTVLMRNVIAHTATLSEANTMLQTAPRTSSYWYLVGDAETSAKLYRTSPTIFDTWTYGQDPSGPGWALPNIVYHGMYEDRFYADLAAASGSITPTVAQGIARDIAMDASVIEAVYDLTSRDLWVAYAEGLQSAALSQFSHVNVAEQAELSTFSDDFANAGASRAKWLSFGPLDTIGSGVIRLRGSHLTDTTQSEAAVLADMGTSYFTDNLRVGFDIKLASGAGGIGWGFQGLMPNGEGGLQYGSFMLALGPDFDLVMLAAEGVGTLAAASVPGMEFDTWYRVELVSTLSTFEVWLAPRGQTLEKVIEVSQEAVGVTPYDAGAVALFAENEPSGDVQFDNVSITGVRGPARDLTIPIVRAAASETITMPVYLADAGGVAGVQFDLLYDRSMLGSLTVSKGAVIASDTNWTVQSSAPEPGRLRVMAYNTMGVPLPAGSRGEVVRIGANTSAAAQLHSVSLLDLTDPILSDGEGEPLEAATIDGAVRVVRRAECYLLGQIDSPKQVDVPFAISLTAMNEYEDVATDYNGEASLSDLTGTITPTTVQFAAGVYSGNVTISQLVSEDRITAMDSTDSTLSVQSNAFDVTGALPAAPSNLTAAPVSTNTVTLRWQDNSGNEDGFCIKRSTNGSTWVTVTDVGADTTTFQDGSCSAHTRYYYKVQAWNGNGDSPFSNTATVTTCRFGDVPAAAPIWRYVESIAQEGITSGCQQTPPLFCPDSAVTRGQMAVFLCRAAGMAPLNRETPTFADVPKTNAFYTYVEAIYQAGITAGCRTEGGLKYYCPANAVTRGQMAVFLCRAAGIAPYNNPTPTFTDMPKTNGQYTYVEAMFKEGITAGCVTTPPRKYCPDSAVTRGQMAVFLCRAFDLGT